MRRIEMTVASLWLLIGIAVSGQSLQLGLIGPFGPASGFFPLISGLILAVSAGLLLVSRSHHLPDGHTLWSARESALRVGAIVVLMAVLILLMPYLGFLLAGCLVTPLMIRAVGRVPWLGALGIGIPAPIAVDLLFVQVLNSPLPRGIMRGIL